MRERSYRWLCLAAVCAALFICVGVPILAADASPSNVNIDLKDTDVKSAIEALFRGTGKNYSIDSNVQGTISALSIQNVPFDTALKSLAKSSGLVYRQDAGVYIISMKPDVSQMASAPTSATADVGLTDTTTDQPEVKIEKIPLNNVSASEILSILQGNNNNRSYGGYGMGGGMMGGMGGYGMMGGGMGGGYGGYGGGGGYGGYGGGGGGYGGYGGGSSYGGYGGSRSYGGGGYGGYGGGMSSGYRSW